MDKKSLAATSLIAAIPAAGLFAVSLMSVMSGLFDQFPIVLMVAMILLLVTSAAVMLFPGYILIYHKSGATATESKNESDSETAAVPSVNEDEDVAGAFDDEASADAFDDDDDFGDEVGDEFEFDEDDDEDF